LTVPNPAGFDEADEKKWILSRLDALHSSMLHELRLLTQRLGEIKNNEVNRIKGRRNNILSALAIAITIIFGIYSVEPPDLSIYIPVTIILIIGLYVFITHNLTITKILIALSQASKEVTEEEGTITFSQSFLIGRSAVLAFTPYQYCINYVTLMSLYGFALSLRLRQIADKARKEKSLNKEIQYALTMKKTDFEDMPKTVPLLLANFDTKQEVPKLVLELIEQQLSKYYTDKK